MHVPDSILDFLKHALRNAGADRWEAIANAAGVAKSLPRKLVYDDRRGHGPGVLTIQPLYTYLRQVERGEKQLPQVVAEGAQLGQGSPDPASSEATP